MLRLNVLVLLPVFGKEAALGFNYNAIRQGKVRGVSALLRGAFVAYRDCLVDTFDTVRLKLVRCFVFKSAAVSAYETPVPELLREFEGASRQRKPSACVLALPSQW